MLISTQLTSKDIKRVLDLKNNLELVSNWVTVKSEETPELGYKMELSVL